MKKFAAGLLTLALLCQSLLPQNLPAQSALTSVQTVFVIFFENYNWSDIYNSPSAPYINQTILPMSSFCNQYYNPPNLHPSLLNYVWLEAGTNFNITDDGDPSENHQNTTNHLTVKLDEAGTTWRAYEEDIDGNSVPLTATNLFAPKHCAFLYFDDVTGTNNPNYPYGIAHIRPYTQLPGDLASNRVARYNFLTPNLCNDGHDSCAPVNNYILQADNWLATEIPRLTNSAAYQNNGAIFITWDEGVGGDGPIGMMVLSKLAKGGGYSNSIHYTHSSGLRTLQNIFQVRPYLGDAVNADDLGDLFLPLNLSLAITSVGTNSIQFHVTDGLPGVNHYLQFSTNLVNWTNIATNIPTAAAFDLTSATTPNSGGHFYRIAR